MAVLIDDSVGEEISREVGGLDLQVRSPESFDVVLRATERAAREIGRLGPARFVSDVVAAGSGPTFFVDWPDGPIDRLHEVPHIVKRHLEQAGINDALISVPLSESPLTERRQWGPYAMELQAYFRRWDDPPIPLTVLHEAAQWLD